MFKKRRGIKLSYNKQGLIYFICMNIKDLPTEVQDKVLNLCLVIAGEDYQALYEVLTCDFRTVEAIARKHYISEKKLYGYRKEFYEKFSWNFSS